jgi:hypothetical protein
MAGLVILVLSGQLLLLIYLLALGRAYIFRFFSLLYDNKHFYNNDIKKGN